MPRCFIQSLKTIFFATVKMIENVGPAVMTIYLQYFTPLLHFIQSKFYMRGKVWHYQLQSLTINNTRI